MIPAEPIQAGPGAQKDNMATPGNRGVAGRVGVRLGFSSVQSELQTTFLLQVALNDLGLLVAFCGPQGCCVLAGLCRSQLCLAMWRGRASLQRPGAKAITPSSHLCPTGKGPSPSGVASDGDTLVPPRFCPQRSIVGTPQVSDHSNPCLPLSGWPANDSLIIPCGLAGTGLPGQGIEVCG